MESIETMDLETLESDEEFRYTMFPLKHMEMWYMYKKSQSYFWVEDIGNSELAKDAVKFAEMPPEKKHFILRILIFFVVSDGLVNENLEKNFDRIKTREYKLWRNYQMMMEDIHSISYSLLLDTYVKDSYLKSQMFDAIKNFPTIRKKVEWIHKWLCRDNDVHRLDDTTINALKLLKKSVSKSYKSSLILENAENVDSQFDIDPAVQDLFKKIDEPKPSIGTVILINAILEGLFFSGSFCAIFWLQEQGELHALGKYNELISRDEGTHAIFAIKAYNNHIKNKLSEQKVHEIFKEAVEIENEFISDALPKGMIGMNSELMSQYIKYVADQLLTELNYSKIYNVDNPFPFMQKQSISVRMASFFESVPTEYRIAGANTTIEQQLITDDENF